MNIYTQLNEPKDLDADSKWLPCLQTTPVKHRQAWPEALLITHIDAIKHYDYDIVPLLNQTVHCIGPKTYDRLKDMGFANVNLHGLYAEDIKISSMPITPCTWLHGDRFSKDFATFTGVTAIQTYKTSLLEASLSEIKKMVTDGNPPEKIYVYSNLVCEGLQDLDWPQTELVHVESCKSVDADKWLKTKSFYPGQETN